MKKNKCILILSTCSDLKLASKIANELVKEKLCACVNIIPLVHSIYRWKNEVHNTEECMILIKTIKDNIESINTFINTNSNYELPESIAIEIDSGSSEYLNWLAKSSI
jgi:periplasmic divalent cation tolerance protein